MKVLTVPEYSVTTTDVLADAAGRVAAGRWILVIRLALWSDWSVCRVTFEA